MSLQIWLPLNGDLHNQGLVDWNPSGSNVAYVNSGKIGKALNTGGVVMPASVTKQVLNNNEFSYCCWIYVKGTTGSTTERAMIFGNEGMTAPNNRKFSIFQYPTCNDLHLSWQNDETNKTFLASHAYGVLPSNEWTHLAVTYKNPTCIVYINGIKRFTYTGTSNSASFEYDTNFIHNSAYHYLNDVRLYDHCLSAKEVKEIAKGLVLHYRLAGPGGENIISNSANFSGWSIGSGWTKGTDSETGAIYYNFSRTGATSNNWVRIIPTNKIDPNNYPNGITVSMDIYTPDISAINQKCLMALQIYKSDGVRIGWTEPSTDLSKVVNNKWTRVSYSFTQSELMRVCYSDYTTSNVSYTKFSFQLVQNGDIKIKNIKAEEGSIATPWCPNPSDALYHTLGYDNGIEYDCSGFGNNGTKSGTLNWASGSPRYSGCYNFPNGTDYIKSSFSLAMEQVSCSFWVKPNSSNGGYSILVANYNNPSSGFWIATNCEGSGLWFYTSAYVIGNSTLNNGTWHHGCFVFDKGIGKWYLNGLLVTTADISSKKTSLSLSSLSIGNSYTGSTWNTKRYGEISDFRLYATALSADDVKELYNVGASITNNGAVMLAGEVVEE